MDKSEIKEKMEKGWFKARVIFEIIGNPKDYIEKAIHIVVDKIKEGSDIEFLSTESNMFLLFLY